FLSLVSGSAEDIGSEKIQRKINAFVQREGVDKISEKLKTNVFTLQLIIDGLCQPEGYDIRTAFDQSDFKTNIVSIEDLRLGTVLTGKVVNATLFGVFVDIGVGKAGLIPMRFITEDKLSKEKRRRSLGLGPGERVEVRVINIVVPESKVTLKLLPFDQSDFKTNIVRIEDLRLGTVLTGKVESATLFGVFVDIGVGKAGLIPMRFITEDKLSKEKRRRSLGLGPGERVEVQVINIVVPQSRITLDLLRVLK
ncbi:hypothetical protein AB205_0135470, partial [Aquarana catesbeiana]